MSNLRYLPKYKNTVVDLNKWYSFLLKRMTVGDYRVTYLRTFETILDANCPFALKENARYIRLTELYPLPGRKQKKVSEDKFRIYMELYNFIMRDAGLLNRDSVTEPLNRFDKMNMWDHRSGCSDPSRSTVSVLASIMFYRF